MLRPQNAFKQRVNHGHEFHGPINRQHAFHFTGFLSLCCLCSANAKGTERKQPHTKKTVTIPIERVIVARPFGLGYPVLRKRALKEKDDFHDQVPVGSLSLR